MIELFEGRLGGGKTYHAVIRIVDHFRRGGVVCTNIELKFPEIKEYVSKKFRLRLKEEQYIALDDEHIGLFHRFTPSGTSALPVLVVVDEAHLTFNSRDYAKTDKLYRETLTFLTQSRKVNTDVIFIAQSVLNMDKQFMRLVQYIWRFRDMSKWKVPVIGIGWPLQQMLAIQYDYDGNTILQKSLNRKNPEVFNLYNTNSLLREFPRLESVETIHTLEKVAAPPRMKYILPILLIGGAVMAIFLYKSVKKDYTPPVTASTSPVPRAVNTTATTASPAVVIEQEKKKNGGAYNIYSEQFISWNGIEHGLKTNVGWYQLGEMSDKGLVTAVSDRRARVAEPDGRTGWVVATVTEPRPSATPITQPTSSPTSTIVGSSDSQFTLNGWKTKQEAQINITPPSTIDPDYVSDLRNFKTGRRPSPPPVVNPVGSPGIR
jgi:hypothetical protein